MGIQLLGEKSMSLADSSLTTSARQNPSSTQVLWLILYVANAVAPRIPSVRFGHIVVALLILHAWLPAGRRSFVQILPGIVFTIVASLI